MRKIRFLVTAAFITLAAATMHARTVNLPGDEFVIASIDFPSSWKLNFVHNGVEGTSPDGAVYISAVAVGNTNGLAQDLGQTQQIMEKHHVTLDKSTQRENRFNVNGMNALEYVYHGHDEDGPTAVSFCKFPIGDKMIVTTYWVSTREEQKHADEIRRIVLSLMPASASGSHAGRKVR